MAPISEKDPMAWKRKVTWFEIVFLENEVRVRLDIALNLRSGLYSFLYLHCHVLPNNARLSLKPLFPVNIGNMAGIRELCSLN